MPKPYNSPFESELIMAALTPEEREVFKKQWEELKGEMGKLVAGDEPMFKPVKLQEDEPTSGTQALLYNEPAHYHQHEIDTIEFLQRGFPPHVFIGFAIGHVVKYAQRSEYKGSPREDLVKMADYAKRALDWYDKTHSQ